MDINIIELYRIECPTPLKWKKEIFHIFCRDTFKGSWIINVKKKGKFILIQKKIKDC